MKTPGAWFQNSHARGRAELKLFCFPYAGGTASIFRNWANRLPIKIQVIPVELPGRGGRLSEPLFTGIKPLVDALAESIPPLLDTPFAFFGHSMGAVIAFELARSLRAARLEPAAILASGRRAPHVPDTDPVTYNLPHDEFIEELQRIDGTPREVLEHAELMELMIPMLRADFQLIQTYEYTEGEPLGCPIVAYGGLQDEEETRELLLKWREMTLSRFKLHMLPGNHFFLRTAEALLLELLTQDLYEVIVH
ncbi:MAG: thioesterase [Blastocatellia bacterium]|nr:thioesterase [Blastocatellia bacterium]